MTDDLPERLKEVDSETADIVVSKHLRENYVNDPARGSYVKSVTLYEELEGDLDEAFDRRSFGIFCSHREYLEQWGDSERGNQYRILAEELGPSGPATE